MKKLELRNMSDYYVRELNGRDFIRMYNIHKSRGYIVEEAEEEYLTYFDHYYIVWKKVKHAYPSYEIGSSIESDIIAGAYDD